MIEQIANKPFRFIANVNGCYLSTSYDLRISSLIVFKENRKKVPVCISLNGVILKNDTLMKGNKRMLKLIDNILYKHHKVEDWTPDFMKE